MAVIVQKFGGTSVGSVEKIKKVAERIIRTQKNGDQVVVVVSAMAGETDRLSNLIRQIMDPPHDREAAVVLSSGETVTSGLLALAIQAQGVKAVSYQGHQVKIRTDSSFTKARIMEINSQKIIESLDQNHIVIVSGFQGMDAKGSITTLGRGGSDTSAVALAASLKAQRCELLKDDVDGIYTADPKRCPNARRLDWIACDEMLELASLGSKVLQARAVEFAKNHKVRIKVSSTFLEDKPGTMVVDEKEIPTMEKVAVRGVSADEKAAKISVFGLPDQPGIAAKLFGILGEHDVNVDMIVQSSSGNQKGNSISFTVTQDDLSRAMEISQEIAKELEAGSVTHEAPVGKVSVVGTGMRSHAGVASKMFSILGQEKINIDMISTSEIKISCIIPSKCVNTAVRKLHEEFLEKPRDAEKKS